MPKRFCVTRVLYYLARRRSDGTTVTVMELRIRSDQDKEGQAEIAICAIIRTVILC